MRKIAVEEGLTGLSAWLREQGYMVVNPDHGEEVIATIVTGLDQNFMNMQDISTTGTVINASGMVPSQILSRLKELD
ncbi:MAG: YkuS family protein [Syntrophomonadaceae bacterium]|nr:YkuS family protein [Syntrophomonadaceae bacterium]